MTAPIAGYTRRHTNAAWAVHGLTASGVIVGMLGLDSIIGGHARAAIVWFVVALVLDGVDGPIRRKLDVAGRVPLLDGHALDLVIDYFTCAILPVAFLDRFDMLPAHTTGATGFVIVFVSALWMARTDQETPDGWFRGFPAEWNMVVPTLFLIHGNRWVNLTICGALCVVTIVRVQFPHPVSVRRHRRVSIPVMLVWLTAMTWLAIAQREIMWLQDLLIVAPLWTVWLVLRRPAELAAERAGSPE